MKDSVVIAPYDTGLYVMVCHSAARAGYSKLPA